MSLYEPKQAVYGKVVARHADELDLFDTIDVERYQGQPVHEVVTLRKMGNDDLFPYHTPTLYTWVQNNPTDPLTRESLAYVVPRINEKYKWMQMFREIRPHNVTPEFVDLSLTQWWMTFDDTGVAVEMSAAHREYVREQARAFVDLNALERNKMLWPSTDLEGARALLADKPNCWMLRKSSRHQDGRMPASEVFTLSMHNKQADGSWNCRLINVCGVGLYMVGSESISSFAAFNPQRRPPDFICVVDALEYLMRAYQLSADKLVPRESET